MIKSLRGLCQELTPYDSYLRSEIREMTFREVVPSFDPLAFFLSWSSPRFSCYGLFSFLLALVAHPTLRASEPLPSFPPNQSSFAK